MNHGRSQSDGFREGLNPSYTLTLIRDRFPGLADLLASAPDADLFERLRAAESIGRPLGDDRSRARIVRRTGRVLKPGSMGQRARWSNAHRINCTVTVIPIRPDKHQPVGWVERSDTHQSQPFAT